MRINSKYSRNSKTQSLFVNCIDNILGNNRKLEKKEIPIELNNEFLNNIKIENNDVNKIIKKKAFLDKINGNVEMLQNLSIDRLKKLEKYYNNVIEENKIKISKLS